MILSIDIQLIIQVPAELRRIIEYNMVKMHKLTKGGQTIYPATIYDAVVNPKTRKSLATEMSGLNKGSAISTQFDTDFSKTRLGIPKENRSTGKILSYRNGATGELTVEMYMGTSMDDQYWSDDLFWCPLLPSTKFPFINITAITGNNYNTPDAARNALPNTYNKKIGLVFTYRDLTNRYRVYLYNSETSNYIPLDSYMYDSVVYNSNKSNTRLSISSINRRKGFILSYQNEDRFTIEIYKSDSVENSNWINDKNWIEVLTIDSLEEVKNDLMTIRHMLQDVSINKVYDELLLANKTIDGVGNIVNGNGIVIERIDIPAGEEYIYTNAYSVYFYRDNGTLLGTVNMGASTGKNISKREIPSEASYCRAWNNNARDFYYLSFNENFIPLEFGITQLPETYLDKNLITNDNLIDGYNNVNGSLQSNEAYNTTRLIRVVDNITSVFTNAFSVAVYAADGTWIGYRGSQAKTFREVMTGEKNWEYIIFNFNSVDSPFVSLNYYPCNPQNVRNVKLDRDEIINMAYKGKKFCSFGDSIVELISWQKYVWKYLQFSTHYCRGIGGSKVTSISPQTKKVDENGYYNAAHPEEGTITIQDNMCGDGRINTIPTDTDVLVIYASANDITANAQIGELDDQDETHLKYAYGLMLRKIIKRLPDAKIFACIPHNFYNSHNNADYPYKNNIGLTIQDYGSVIREVCAIYSVPVIDVNALSGISTLNITTYLQDQVHPNSAGGMKIANVVIDALIQYVLMDLTNPYIEDTKM
ncbi:SGNH/GDSL hydrolase family protein [Phocaeicola vulgatus]|uniref:SGNH/GDSL hydrolase family protein n=1 Tax=Phocaeicola vulgatus TaxID=821 RepID=UPI001E2C8737|nr:SGNH/GDSL hydrolase family protein [Phocaeicola vulgatus]